MTEYYLDASICDEHEWAGYGDCPGCLKEYPDEVAAMKLRMEIESTGDT